MDPPVSLGDEGLVLPGAEDGLCLTSVADDPTADSVCVFHSSALTGLSSGDMEIVDMGAGLTHLQIPPGQGKMDQSSLNGHQLFIVYHDAFTCGACHNVLNDMVAFIQHKSLHTFGMDVYKCELCKLFFGDRPTLIEHYTGHHNLDFSIVDAKDEPEEILQPPSPDETTELPEDPIPSPPPPPSKPLSSSSKRRKSVQTQRKDTVEEEVLSETHLNSAFTKDNESANTPLKEEKKPEEKDFTFIYSTETCKGSKVTFTRSWFRCLHCDYRSRMNRCLVKHMHEKHNDMFASVHDNMEVKGEPEYDVHQKAGDTSTRFMRMSTYNRMFPLIGQNKKRRLEKQDIPGVYTCTHCNKVFSRLRYLRKHSKQHSPAKKNTNSDKQFSCDQCSKCFKFNHYLQAHKRSHDAKVFRCNECDFVSSINAAIHAHRQVHNQGSVLCEICGYAYSDRSTLAKHLRVHDQARPFACSFAGCTWRFKTEIMCRAHVRAHTTEGKFRCWICGYLFRHKHHLQRHVSKMHKLKLSHKEMDARCKYNDDSTTIADVTSTLSTNIDLSTTPQLVAIQCRDCGLDFDAKEQLGEHFLKFHHLQLSVEELQDFCNANLIADNNAAAGGKYVITSTINPGDDENNELEHEAGGIEGIGCLNQQVYVINQDTLAQFQSDPNSLNQFYVQEEQEVPICTDSITDVVDPNDDKAYFVSVL